jgi:hypothetical protein
LERITDTAQIDAVLDTLMATDWVVYSKPCITHTETVVNYLGRYSHRIALSDARLLQFADGEVELAYTDYRDGRHKVMTLAAEELLRRFLLHVLPKGMMRIRHFGFLANRRRRQRLGEIRKAINAAQAQHTERGSAQEAVAFNGYPCPSCRQGRSLIIGPIAPKPKPKPKPILGHIRLRTSCGSHHPRRFRFDNPLRPK